MNTTTTQLTPARTGVKVPASQIPLRNVPDVRTLLVNEQAKGQLAAVAASHMKPERMMRLIANAIRTTPKLADCDPMSLLGALMQCASLGLEPNTVLGHAYLIPFDQRQKNPETGNWETVGTNVQLIIGYKGLIDLARRSGHITSLAANIHYSDDELWEYEEGTESTLRHRPGNLRGDKLHAYAIARFKDGGHAYVVLPWAKVMQIRDNSEGWKKAVRTKKTADSPWAKHEDEMAKKTAIRALSKYLPLSVEFIDAVQLDGARADYHAFAMDPTQGMAEIEQQSQNGDEDEAPAGDVVDPDTGEVTQSEIEDKRAVQQTVGRRGQAADPADAAPPARRKPRGGATAAPVEQQADELPLDEGTAKAPDDEIDALIERVVEWVEADLADGASLEASIEGYATQIDYIRKADQGKHDALIARLEQAADA